MHTDVRDVTAGPGEPGRQLEGRRRADCLDGDICSESAGELLDHCEGILAAVVDDDVGTELLRRFESCVGEIDGDDVRRAVQPRAHHRRETDRAGADDGDDIARTDLAVEDANFVSGREDVGEHQDRGRR